MLSFGLLVHVRQLTGSFAAVGVVTGVDAVTLGVSCPRLGQLVDRRGQTSVLLGCASVAAMQLVVMALLPAGVPLADLVALAAGIGIGTPPVDACLRSQLSDLLPDPGATPSTYPLEMSSAELTYIIGPLVLRIGGMADRSGPGVGGVALVVATAVFAAQPSSRRWRSTSHG
jgi:hypothetical protein